MSNERLRAALLKKGLTPAQLAERLQVDIKTAERWISWREAYRKHRFAAATLLGVEESYLWPNTLTTIRYPLLPKARSSVSTRAAGRCTGPCGGRTEI